MFSVLYLVNIITFIKNYMLWVPLFKDLTQFYNMSTETQRIFFEVLVIRSC